MVVGTEVELRVGANVKEKHLAIVEMDTVAAIEATGEIAGIEVGALVGMERELGAMEVVGYFEAE